MPAHLSQPPDGPAGGHRRRIVGWADLADPHAFGGAVQDPLPLTMRPSAGPRAGPVSHQVVLRDDPLELSLDGLADRALVLLDGEPVGGEPQRREHALMPADRGAACSSPRREPGPDQLRCLHRRPQGHLRCPDRSPSPARVDLAAVADRPPGPGAGTADRRARSRWAGSAAGPGERRDRRARRRIHRPARLGQGIRLAERDAARALLVARSAGQALCAGSAVARQSQRDRRPRAARAGTAIEVRSSRTSGSRRCSAEKRREPGRALATTNGRRADPASMRINNMGLILRLLRDHGGHSRAGSPPRPTVQGHRLDLIGDLLDRRLVQEAAREEPQRQGAPVRSSPSTAAPSPGSGWRSTSTISPSSRSTSPMQ